MKCDVPSNTVVVLDACVLINVLASGRAEDILRGGQGKFVVCSVVKGESIFLRPVDSSAPPDEVTLDPLTDSGCLDVCELSGKEEETLYVDYATQLDDGEAMSLALAQSRGFLLATDDRKARRLFLDEVRDPARLLSTAQLFKKWSERMNVSPKELKHALLQVTLRGRFFPSRDDNADFDWWSTAVR